MKISRIILIILLFFVFFEIGLFSSYTLATGEVPDPGELINMQVSTVTSFFSPDNVGGLLIKDPDNVNVTNRFELADKLSEVADVDGVNVENMTITTVDDMDKDEFNVTVTAFGYSKPSGKSGSIIINGEPDYKISRGNSTVWKEYVSVTGTKLPPRVEFVSTQERQQSEAAARTKNRVFILKFIVKTAVRIHVAAILQGLAVEGKDREPERLAVCHNLRLDLLCTENDAIGVLDGQFSKIYASGLLENGQILRRQAAETGLLRELRMERRRGRVVVEREHHLAGGENGVVAICFLQICRQKMGDPALAVDHVRGPAQLLDGLEDAAGEEDRTLVVVFEGLAGSVAERLLAAEIVLVVNEVDLDARGRDGGDLDDQGPVHVRDDDVHAGKADHLVELVLPLVDTAEPGHERSDFTLALLDALRQITADIGDIRLREIRVDLGVDEKDSLLNIAHNYKDKKIFSILRLFTIFEV